MKKNVLLIAFLSFTAVLSAQISVGLSAGINHTSWKWDVDNLPFDWPEYQSAYGWRAVLLSEIPLHKQLKLRTELGTQVYANGDIKSFIFESDFLSGDFDGSQYRYRENYQFWEVSVLAEVMPIRKISWFYLVAGATGGRLTKGWTSFKALEPDKEQLSGDPIDVRNDNWHHNSFATDFGLGGNIPLGKSFKLKLESRFLYFFNELDDLDNVHSRISPVMMNLACVYQL
ncbi:MAG TPA: hypothetical protein VK168_20475 [Saprospiraceae bacterium]|nr:hypothetical protein [Saprospiraceae bacterium]